MIEAGVFIPCSNPEFKTIQRWCKNQYKESKLVLKKEIENKILKWKPVFRNRAAGVSKKSRMITCSYLLSNLDKFIFSFYDDWADTKKDTRINYAGETDSLAVFLKEDWEAQDYMEFDITNEEIKKLRAFLEKAGEQHKTLICVGSKNKIHFAKYRSTIRIKNLKNNKKYALVLHKTRGLEFEMNSKEKIKLKEWIKSLKKTKLWANWWDRDSYGYLEGEKTLDFIKKKGNKK